MAVNVAGNDPPHVETGGMPPVVVPVVPIPPVVVPPVVVSPPVVPPVIVVPLVDPLGAPFDFGLPSSIEQPCAKARSPSERRLVQVNAAVRCREARISTSTTLVLNRFGNVVIRRQ
jgi:hypothetical protein